MSPTPARGRRFELRDRSFDPQSGEATFAYDLDGEVLAEHVVVPVGDTTPSPAALDDLLDLCHLALGTSYFKLTAPRQVVLARPARPAMVALAHHIYDEGMREFAVVNDLGVPLEVEIVAGEAGDATATLAGRVERPLLPIGGGKDSAAVLTVLGDATAVTISPTGAQRRLTSAAGVPLLEVTRTLDPRLSELTAAGGWNGHIPVTAINSALSALVATLHGHDGVVLGNERSSSEPTRVVDGVAVNHQHSKSFAFEEVFARAASSAGIRYFSLLRQLSGLSVAGIVAGNHALRGSFLSCNKAFKRSRQDDEPQTWCLDCPKCHYTFLAFAPFLSVGEAEAVFGGNPLADPALTGAFGELWDLEAKPFECVGELAESAVAMAWLGQSDGWREQPVVVALAGRADVAAKELGAAMDEVLTPSGPHLVPDDLAAEIRRRAAAVAPRR